MPVSVARSLVIIAAVAGTIFFTRLCPFLFFPPGKPIPPVIQYLGKVLPPAVIGMLVIYCLKAVSITSYPYGLPEFIAVAVVILLHVWKRNNLLSIGVGTVLYMVLIQAVFSIKWRNIMKKKPFVTKEQLEEIVKKYPTPFHLYDEKGIRENAKAVKEAFSWNPGFREYFAVKATPNPYILDILKEYDCGCDCASLTELMLADSQGFDGKHIMFSSNDTPAEEFKFANELGAIINLDDFTHIDFLEKTIGKIPETISCRYNPGGVFKMSNGIMDNPGDAKYGFTHEQIIEGFKILKEKGAKHFGVHAFLASNTVTNEYYPKLARQLFELVVELRDKTGCDIQFINLSGGVGVPYTPDQTPNDIRVIGQGVRRKLLRRS